VCVCVHCGTKTKILVIISHIFYEVV